MKAAIDVWANFLANEKLTPKTCDVMTLLRLCEALAANGRPNIKSHADKVATRRVVANTAINLGIDLASIYKPGTRKLQMGRGLLDVWNEEYAKRFGSNVGTAGANEVRRRGIVTKISKDNECTASKLKRKESGDTGDMTSSSV